MSAGRHRQEPSRGSRAVPVVVAAVVLAAVAGGVALATRDDGPDGTARLTATATPTASATSASPTASPTPVRSATTRPAARPSRPPAKPATLVLTVTGAASYLEVREPTGRRLLAATYGKGKTFTFRQPQLYVVIGDAGAVRLVVNGKVSAPAGRPGQVLRFTVRAAR